MTVKENVILVANYVDNISGQVKKSVRGIERLTDAVRTTETTTTTANSSIVKIQQTFAKLKTVGQDMARQQILVNKMMSGGAQKMVDAAGRTNELGDRFDSLAGSLRMPYELWREFNEGVGEFSSKGGKWGNKLRMLTHGLRGFRMEMLSVMFFGMGMQKFFTGLLSPAMELTGVFEIFKTALAILFLPAALLVQKWAIWFLKWVLGLSPATRDLIGKIVLFGAALGGLLFFVGMMALGLGGILTVFGSLIAIIVSIGAAIITLVTSPIALLLAAFLIMPTAVAGAEAGISAFGTVAKSATNLVDVGFQKLLNTFPSLRLALEEAGIHTQSFGEAWHDIWVKWIDPFFTQIKKKVGDVWANVADSWTENWPKFKERFKETGKTIGKAVLAGFLEVVVGGWKIIFEELRAALASAISSRFKQSQGGRIIEKMKGGYTAEQIVETELFPTAHGGIVTRPQARLVGEAGPEAIIPLNKAGMMGGISISIVINAAINSSIDLNNLARRIGAETASSLERNFRR